jgi:hypothetical protein
LTLVTGTFLPLLALLGPVNIWLFYLSMAGLHTLRQSAHS